MRSLRSILQTVLLATRPPKDRPAWARLAVALVCVLAGWVARISLSGAIGAHELPFIFFFPAIVIAAWYGGLAAGILSIVLSAIAANWSFVEPIHSLSIANRSDLAALLAFLIAALIIVVAIESMHEAQAGLMREIDRRRRADIELATTISSIGDGVIATDDQGRITLINPEAQRLTGWTAAEALGLPLADVFRIINEQTRKPAESPVDKALRQGTIVGLANHTLLLAKNGVETPIDDSAAPIRDAGGHVFGVVLVFRDAAIQRAAQQAQARLAAIVQYSGDAIATKDLNGVIQSWNQSAEELFGYRADEIIGRPVTILIPPDRIAEEEQILSRLREGLPAERLETVRRTKDGRDVHVSVSVSPLKDADGRVVGASKVVHDISSIVAARQALRHERELLATTLASIGDAVVVTDPAGNVTFINAVAQRLTGWSGDEATGQLLTAIFKIVNEQTRAVVEDPVAKVLRLGTVVGLANHTLLVRKDGTEIPIDDTAAPIRGVDGSLFGVVLVFRDFTERKQIERERERLLANEQAARREAEQAGRMKDEFLATLSHELRTPLNAILGYATLMRTYQMEQKESAEAVSIIERNARIQARLIDDLLDMNRIISGKIRLDLQTVRIEEVIEEALNTVRPSAEAKRIRLEKRGGRKFDALRGDPARIQQIIWNLLANAVKFTPSGGTVDVAVEPNGSSLDITVRDTGQGIEPEFLPFVFDRFRQADATITRIHGGLGLGLSIGTVRAHSEGKDQGASFTVSLPMAPKISDVIARRSDILKSEAAPTATTADLTGVRALLVDDESDATTLTRRVLEERGARVATAASSAEALAKLSEGRFSVVISDLGMPDEDGYALMRRIRSLEGDNRNIPAIALTAFARDEDRERAAAVGFGQHLAKPVEPATLIHAVASLVKRA
jgi:PAS domain S-box-containing protein